MNCKSSIPLFLEPVMYFCIDFYDAFPPFQCYSLGTILSSPKLLCLQFKEHPEYLVPYSVLTCLENTHGRYQKRRRGKHIHIIQHDPKLQQFHFLSVGNLGREPPKISPADTAPLHITRHVQVLWLKHEATHVCDGW